jgi:hypothetical protein
MDTEEKEILGLRSRASDEIAKRLRSIHDKDYYSVLGGHLINESHRVMPIDDLRRAC